MKHIPVSIKAEYEQYERQRQAAEALSRAAELAETQPPENEFTRECMTELADMAFALMAENEELKEQNSELQKQNEIIAGSVMEVFETFLPLLEEV